ncbi:hypothetical protein Trydic_g3747 [Trypoxylus dichotomus]
MANQTPGSKCDTGSKYEVSVMAFIASRLSKSNNVENYHIFCNFDEAHPFDDIVAEIRFKGLEHSQIYAIQVKSGKDKLNINKYLDGYAKIIREGGLKLGESARNDRIAFLYFCSKSPTKNIFSITTNDSTTDLILRPHRRTCNMLKAIFNNAEAKELFSEDPKAIDQQNFLGSFHLFLNQPDTQRIIHILKGIWSVDDPSLIFLYLENYFSKNRNGLDKATFEHELLKIRLSDYVVTPTKAIAFQHEAVGEWNRLTLEQDVTIVQNETNVEQYLYGCILQNIPDVINIDEWNRCVDNIGKLDHGIKNRLKAKSLKAETLRDLTVQTWIDGKTPLLLKVDTLLPPLQEFSHLKKRYVIIDSNVERRCNEIKSYKLSVFTHLDDVKADKVMESIPVSLQELIGNSGYKILRLRLTDDRKLTQLLRILDPNIAQDEEENCGLERFFIDQHGESVYNIKNGGPVPVIGEAPFHVHCKYLPRNLREAVKRDEGNKDKSNQFTINYAEKLLPEEDVLKGSNSKIIVITGEPGMGKTTLLNSLFHSCDSKYYILFIDLARHQPYLRKGKLKSFKDLLRFSREKCRNLPHKCFLYGLHDYVDRLVLILDSFDEVVATCKQEVVELVQDLQKVRLRKIIIASRLTAVDLLNSKVDAKTFKIEGFNQESEKQCIIDCWNLDISNLRHIPSQYLTNPLYLNMLKYIAESETNLEVVNAWNLYETVVKLKMEDYCRRMEPYILDDNEARSILIKHQELALNVMFGINEVTKKFETIQLDRSNFIRLGLIVRSDKENPVFVHHTFIEFFVTKWLIENVGRDDAKYIYELILDTCQAHILNIYSETLPLHKAFLDENYNKVLRLCEENKRCLLDMDGLGRGVLHLAVMLGKDFTNSTILNSLIRRMRREDYDIYMCDKIMNWTWIDYLEKRNLVEELIQYSNFLASQAYLNYCATHAKSLNDLLERRDFNSCYHTAIFYSSISLIRALLSWKYHEYKTFLEFRDMCLHSPTSVSREHLDIKLTEEGLDGTHLVCIYGNMQAIEKHIGSGINFNEPDIFRCTPLHYSIMAAQNKEIIASLLENYGYSNPYVGLGEVTTILHLSIATDDVHVTKILLEFAYRREYDSPTSNTIETLTKAEIASHFTRTLLQFAIEYGNKDAIEILLKYNPDANFLAQPLHKAVILQQTEIIKLLLQHGADPNTSTDLGNSLVKFAFRMKNESIIHMLLSHNVDFHIFMLKTTPLIRAVLRSTNAIVELLLRNGADANQVDEFGWPALMYTVYMRNSEDILQLLLKYNADVNFEDKIGETPLSTAIKRRHFEISEMLLQNGVRINRVDSSGWTLLIHAVQREDDDIARMLLNLHADVNIKGKDGVTPLCMAVKRKRTDIVQILLEKGADVNCFDGCGVSPLMVAVETGNMRLAKILLENDANVNLKNECGVTALYAAVFKRDVAMTELLLERGADSNIITTGEDIFRNAKRIENLEIVVWLLKNRPTSSNDLNVSHPVASIIERVTENWVGINLEDKLHSLDPGRCNLMEQCVVAASEDDISSAIRSLINEPSNGDVVDIFINNVANHKIARLTAVLRSIGSYCSSMNSFKILWRYYENRLQLFRTAVELNLYFISEYLCQDISLNVLNELSVNYLSIAIHKGNTDCVRMLLDRGHAVNKPDPEGFMPLMLAVGKRAGHVCMLLENGADVNFETDGSGLTALYIAALIGDRHMVRMLLRHGANQNINTSEDVFESCVKLAHFYGELNLSVHCTTENRNRVKDIIKDEAFVLNIT